MMQVCKNTLNSSNRQGGSMLYNSRRGLSDAGLNAGKKELNAPLHTINPNENKKSPNTMSGHNKYASRLL